MTFRLRHSCNAGTSARLLASTAPGDPRLRPNAAPAAQPHINSDRPQYYSRPPPPRTFMHLGLGWSYGIGCGAGPYFGMGVAVDRNIVFGAGAGVGLFCGIGFGVGTVTGVGSGFVPIGWTSR